MYKMIAVEDGLTNVVQALHASGFKTAPLEGKALYNIQAVVVKGDGTNNLSPDWPVKLPVINASGRSAEEVVEVLRDRFS
ncbi:YkuS family protein [Desulfosporosinus sp. FKB]|uniref:YkuS family protein n=1 Tax=unclassified Desulfosporosinus TaxID=2633794 RepID=UPI000B49C7E6|nr:YkuS family protein [Desulfosporosinus sp. FKB]